MSTRPIPGKFTKIPGGYSRQLDNRTTVFVPDCSAAGYDPLTGTLTGYAPDYDKIEAERTPAKAATNPGEYAYQYETEHAPTGCDFSADLSYYGGHYFLRPLRDDLPRLHGRGITYNEKDNDYFVTVRAYDKLKQQYKISREMLFD